VAKDYDFRPDQDNSVDLDKLLLTQRQRFNLLRWVLYGVFCLAGLLLQDAVLCRVDIRGGCTDLVPCLIFMITALQGAEHGSIFALIAAVFYYCTGSAPGLYVIPLITVSAVLVAVLRQAALRRGFFSILLCAALTMFVYEFAVFGIGLFLGQTLPQRWMTAVMTAAVTLIAVPVAYPIVRVIGKIGGEAWKE
jgi:hypothetical protein